MEGVSVKDHIEVRKSLDLWELPVADAIEQLQDFSVGVKEARLVWGVWDNEFELVGWRPMNEKELFTAERRRKAARLTAQKAKDEKRTREIEELQKLARKYPDAV